MLFSKVRVTVQLVKDALAIRSILPMEVGEQTGTDATVAMDDSHAGGVDSETVASEADSPKTTPAPSSSSSTATSAC